VRSNTFMHTAAQSLSGCIVSLKALPHVQVGWKDAFSSDVLIPLPGKKLLLVRLLSSGATRMYACCIQTHTHTQIHLSIVPNVVSVVPAIIISGGKVILVLCHASRRMYVRKHVIYVYTCIHAYIHTCMHTCMHTYIRRLVQRACPHVLSLVL
jgi:hypothetical protein